MKNELGIEVCCANCLKDYCTGQHQLECKKVPKYFVPTQEAYESRIKELQEQQFTGKEAEKIERFLIHGYQMIISKNKKIFSKLEKMKGE